MRTRAASLLAVLALVVLPSCGSANPTPETTARVEARKSARGVALKRIGSFDEPVYVTGAPGFPKLLFVVEQEGRVVVLRNGRRAGSFLDVRGLVGAGGERGLLSIAFPPDYPRSRRFYVYYTDNEGDIRVDEFRRRGATRAARGSRRSVIEVPHRVNSNHNGGQLQFLGDLLYLGTGDGGSGGDPPNNAQDRGSLLGKLLRIDPRPSGGRPYSIPASNPFAGSAGGRGEIYSYGLRNPFRFSFDRVTSPGQPRLAIADVGQDRFEEIDYTTAAEAGGANFGWDAFEGKSRYTGTNSGTPDPGGTVKPIFVYGRGRDGGSCTVIGGYVVGDRRLPSLRGRYVYADLCAGQLRSLVPGLRRARDDRRLGLRVSTPSSFGEDTRGRIYVSSLEGPVYRLVPR
ncbi:MAG TPA: PQQ-dependent sugar dehydrogenase [Solirubrobacterales bacterium]